MFQGGISDFAFDFLRAAAPSVAARGLPGAGPLIRSRRRWANAAGDAGGDAPADHAATQPPAKRQRHLDAPNPLIALAEEELRVRDAAATAPRALRHLVIHLRGRTPGEPSLLDDPAELASVAGELAAELRGRAAAAAAAAAAAFAPAAAAAAAAALMRQAYDRMVQVAAVRETQLQVALLVGQLRTSQRRALRTLVEGGPKATLLLGLAEVPERLRDTLLQPGSRSRSRRDRHGDGGSSGSGSDGGGDEARNERRERMRLRRAERRQGRADKRRAAQAAAADGDGGEPVCYECGGAHVWRGCPQLKKLNGDARSAEADRLFRLQGRVKAEKQRSRGGAGAAAAAAGARRTRGAAPAGRSLGPEKGSKPPAPEAGAGAQVTVGRPVRVKREPLVWSAQVKREPSSGGAKGTEVKREAQAGGADSKRQRGVAGVKVKTEPL
ncbi:hypothetical protein GPECTOR_31g343 [Gonium pectorale]|uniref:Uncharacterized protein n=1 Tax=Gonium pectorale TaxID=33097 RepID=A0A150GDQ5_GONPE|nr:hypothetical protein GPECTOR_31g343 [Gonium pectorale]|eukprot:KXZ47981.1 hypothetical protein GPECTOR_31g343 [Gonium pectorale]